MICAGMLGHHAGEWRLIVRRARERKRKTLNAVLRASRQSGNGAGIKPAGEKQSYGDIRNQMRANGIIQQSREAALQQNGNLADVWDHEPRDLPWIPPWPCPWRASPIRKVQEQPVTGRKGKDGIHKGDGFGDAAEKEIGS